MSNEIQANKMIFKVLTKTVEQYLKFGSKLTERKEFDVNVLLDLQLWTNFRNCSRTFCFTLKIFLREEIGLGWG